MKTKLKNKIKLKNLIKKLPIFLLTFIFIFSNSVLYLPNNIKDNQFINKIKVENTLAAITEEIFPTNAKSIEEELWRDQRWRNPTRIYSDNSSSARVTSSGFDIGRRTEVLKATGFDFRLIPDNAVIEGVTVRINSWYDRGSASIDLIQLLNIEQERVGINQADINIPLTKDKDTVIEVGKTNDLWKNDLTTKWIKDKNFGVGIGLIATENNSDVYIDYVTIEISYNTHPDAISFINNVEHLLDGGRSSQEITIKGTNFGIGPPDLINNVIKIGTYTVPIGHFGGWDDTTISFKIPETATTYGGTGMNGLIVRANGQNDNTPLEFYIYPRISSLSGNSEQIGETITVLGDHFGILTGSATANTKIATIDGWGENKIVLQIPGQEGTANINGEIKITTSSLFLSNPLNFTILAPSIASSNPVSSEIGLSSVSIDFLGLGFDTDIGINPIIKLAKIGETDIIGTNLSTIVPYQRVNASFNLFNVTTGLWDLVITNMDGQTGICSECFSVNPPSGPVVTGINPAFGFNYESTNISTVSGLNFQNGATVKLTKTSQTDIPASTNFTLTDVNTLSNGAFNLAGVTLGYWNVVVTNPDLKTGSYGNEIDTGFEIKPSTPSELTNLYQFKNNIDTAQPPTTEISIGEAISGQTDVYFRMDMQGGLIEELYYPQVELKPIGVSFDETFTEGTGIFYDGNVVQGWVNITGVDGSLYHWQARIRNSAGTSEWTSFGGNSDPNDIDIYFDNTPPTLETSCANSIFNIADLSATIQWNTSDTTSGSQNPPGSGAYATTQIQYIETANFINWISSPGITTSESSWENSPHQVTLSPLFPGTEYTFIMKAKDSVGNEAISENCTFTTEGARPIKTIEFFILQEQKINTGDQIAKAFQVVIPENMGTINSIEPKSAYLEISGISGATTNQTINVGLLRKDQSTSHGPIGANYTFDSTGTTTPFTILFDALNPQGTGQENMTDITTGDNYIYTLFLNGNGVDVSLFSAKLIITYNYKP